MNLTLSKRADYVVRSALSLARAHPKGGFRKIREVVAEMGVPHTFASQILKDLVKAGLAESRAGKDGGYRLVRPPTEIRLLSVIEAGEGPLRSDRCGLGDGPCRWDSVCPLHETWTRATGAMRSVLAESTLADLLSTDMAIASGRYRRPADSHRLASRSVLFNDWVQVESGRGEIERRLREESWLAPSVHAAFAEVDALRAELDSAAPSWMVSRVEVAITDPPESDAEDLSLDVAWEAETVEGLSCHGDARMSLAVLDAERTEIRVTGGFRPPRAEGRPLVGADESEDDVLQRMTDAFVRATLRKIAEALEERPAQVR